MAPAAGFAALDAPQRLGERPRGGDFAFGDPGFANVADDAVEFQPAFALGAGGHLVGQFRKIHPVLAGGDFIQHLAQTIHIRLRGSRPFRRHEPFGSNKGPLAVDGHQPDVREFRLAVDEDHIRGFHVAVRQASCMQMMQRLGKAQAHVDAIRGVPRHTCRLLMVGAQGAGFIFYRIDISSAPDVVAEFHHIIIERHAVGAASDMQDVDQARVVAGDRLEFQDALELAFESARILEVFTPHHFHRPQRPGHAAGEPHLAVCSATDFAQHLVIGNRGTRT